MFLLEWHSIATIRRSDRKVIAPMIADLPFVTLPLVGSRRASYMIFTGLLGSYARCLVLNPVIGVLGVAILGVISPGGVRGFQITGVAVVVVVNRRT